MCRTSLPCGWWSSLCMCQRYLPPLRGLWIQEHGSSNRVCESFLLPWSCARRTFEWWWSQVCFKCYCRVFPPMECETPNLIRVFPRSNRRTEVAVQSAKRLLRSNIDSSDRLDNDKLLGAVLQLWNTPHPNCKLSPAEIVFVRPLRGSFAFLNRLEKIQT